MKSWAQAVCAKLGMSLFEILLCVAVWVAILSLALTGCSQPVLAPHAEQPPQPKPWVIYHTAGDVRIDNSALSAWIMQRARTGGTRWAGGVGNEGPLVIDLSSREDATPRSELLELAKEAEKRLPKGCPLKIEVETVAEAIAREEKWIRECEEAIARLKAIHNETPSP